MVVDEIATIARIFLVEVCLADRFIREKLILTELEDEAEARTVKVFHSNIREVLQSALVAICDKFREGYLVLHCRKPELWNTRSIFGDFAASLSRCVFFSGLLFFIVLFLLSFAGFYLGIAWLETSIYDSGSLLVERSELGKIPLFKLKDLFLKLSFKFCVLFLHSFETGDTSTDWSRERLDVA